MVKRAQEGGSEQEREDNGKMLEPEHSVRMPTRGEQTAQLESDSSLVDRFEVWSLASLLTLGHQILIINSALVR